MLFLLDQPQHLQHFAALVDSALDGVRVQASIFSFFQDFFHHVFKVYRILRRKKGSFDLSREGANRSRLFVLLSINEGRILRLKAFPIIRAFRDALDKPTSFQDIHQVIDSTLLNRSFVDQIFGLKVALLSRGDPFQEEEAEVLHGAFLSMNGSTVAGAVLLEDNGGDGNFGWEGGRRRLDHSLWYVLFFKRAAVCQICFHDQCAILVLNQSELIQHSSFLNSNFRPSKQVDTAVLSISHPIFFDFCMHGNSLQLQKMKDNRTYSLPSKVHWFKSEHLKSYLAPTTVHSHQLLDPSLLFPNQSTPSGKQNSSRKGFKFVQTKRTSPFACHNKTPSPTDYYAPQISQKAQKSSSTNKLLSKGSRQEKSNKRRGGVGQYDLTGNILKGSFNKGTTIGKADKNTYFTDVQFRTYNYPGPGDYQKLQLRKSHSTIGLIQKASSQQRKQSSKSTTKAIKRQKQLGPTTYETQKPETVSCAAVYKTPYKEKDKDIRQRITEMRNKKKDSDKTGPGKYLKIQDWGQYDKNKHLSNGLEVCSKRTLSIYH